MSPRFSTTSRRPLHPQLAAAGRHQRPAAPRPDAALPRSPAAPAANRAHLPPRQVHYQYWNHTVRTWSERRPAACSLQGDPKPGPAGWGFLNGTPRTEVRPFKTHVIYQNLWYSDGRWGGGGGGWGAAEQLSGWAAGRQVGWAAVRHVGWPAGGCGWGRRGVRAQLEGLCVASAGLM
jgi:hypothetical protein